MDNGVVNSMDACIFPSLADGLVLDSELATPPRQVPVDLGDLSNAHDLRALATQHGVRMSSIFNASWAIVVGRYLGIEQVGFVALSSAEGDHNGAICRVDLDSDSQLRDILRSVNINTRFSYDTHRRSKASALDATRDLANSAVLFKAAKDAALPAAALEEVASRDRFVSVHVTESETEISMYISYSPALITESQALNLTQSLTQALSELVRRPQIPWAKPAW